jgi:7-cyano-7-deazaguanine synthase
MTAADAALVVFSGGQDSTTCLAWALDRYARVVTVGFDYGQRHRVELDCRRQVLARIAGVKPAWAGRLGGDTVLDLTLLRAIGGSALTDDVQIRQAALGLPNTFVPGRNLLFLTAAAACAYRQDVKHIVTGVCETDYSGYPDCRDDTMKALQVALNLGMEQRFVVHTPLMWIDKAATWRLAHDLGGDALVDLVVEHTHTCYEGDRAHVHPWGRGCGTCPACALRAAGWNAFRGATTTATTTTTTTTTTM